jgi:excisionase family DNA binding protein
MSDLSKAYQDIDVSSRLISLKDACELTGLSHSSVLNLTKRGRVYSVRIGKSRFVSRAQLLDWVREMEVNAATPKGLCKMF